MDLYNPVQSTRWGFNFTHVQNCPIVFANWYTSHILLLTRSMLRQIYNVNGYRSRLMYFRLDDIHLSCIVICGLSVRSFTDWVVLLRPWTAHRETPIKFSICPVSKFDAFLGMTLVPRSLFSNGLLHSDVHCNTSCTLM